VVVVNNVPIPLKDVPSWCYLIKGFIGDHVREWRFLLAKLRNPSIIIIRGTGRSGKTALMYNLLDISTDMGKSNYMIGGDPSRLAHIEQIDSLKDVENKKGNITLAIDDIGAIGLTARNHATKENKYLQQLSTIVSHKNITVIISIQNLRLLDVKGLMVSQDIVLLSKLSNSFSTLLERKWIKEDVDHANKYLRYLSSYYNSMPEFNSKDHESKGLFYDHATCRVAYNNLPEYYNNSISKSYSDFRSR